MGGQVLRCGPQLLQGVGIRALEYAVDERGPAVEGGLGQLQAEEPFHEAGLGTGLDAPASECLGDPRVVRQQRGADLVEHVVDPSLHHGDEALDARHDLALAVRLHHPEQAVRVAGQLLERRHVASHALEGLVQTELAALALDLLGIHRECTGVLADRVGEGIADVRDRQDEVVCGVGEADPQTDVLLGQRPVLGELVHVGQHHGERFAHGTGQRQLVVTERPCSQVPGGGAGHHRQHHRTHHRHDLSDHLGRHGTDTRDLRHLTAVEVAELVQLRRQTLAERPGDPLDQRSLVVEEPLGPLGPVHRLYPDGFAEVEVGVACHLEFAHPRQALEGDPIGGIQVGLAPPLVRDACGHLGGRVPLVSRTHHRAHLPEDRAQGT